MGKLKLNLDDLKVESFATTPPIADLKGTVFGQDTIGGASCGQGATCLATCESECPGCGMTNACNTFSWEQTCQDTCNHGLTYTCTTDPNGDCAPLSWGPDTCQGSCTDNGCTVCDNAC